MTNALRDSWIAFALEFTLTTSGFPTKAKPYEECDDLYCRRFHDTDGGGTASSNTDAVNPLVRFFEGRLSIRAVNTPLKDLVQEISKKSGIVIELRDAKAAEKRITVDLVNLPPALALEEILRGFSFGLRYNNRAQLSQAVVLSPVVAPRRSRNPSRRHPGLSL